MKKLTKKRGPKPQEYRIEVRFSEKTLSEIEIARLEKVLSSILVNAQEEVANEHKPESCHLLQSLVG